MRGAEPEPGEFYSPIGGICIGKEYVINQW